MPAITIKNLPDGLYEQIKVNVKAHHRSINGELIAILERVLNAHRPDPAEELARIRGLRASLDLPTLDPRKIRAAVESERATDSV